MKEIEVLYLSSVLVGICILYIVFFFLFQKLFGKNEKISRLKKRSFASIALLVITSVVVYVVSYYVIPDRELGNRFLHAFGGGFTLFLMCLLAMRDADVMISRKIFFITCFIVVTVFGTCNEIIEIILQYYTDFLFSPTLFDVALDITSNTLGFFIASLCLVRFTLYQPSQKHIEVLRSE
jgi:hypothetical protein